MENASRTLVQGTSQMFFMVCLLIILGLCLYYLYKWLNGTGDMMDSIVYDNTSSGMVAMSVKPSTFSSHIVNSPDVPPLYGGGEYSISTWIYITNWGINSGKNKVFLTLSGGGNSFSTLVMYLGQNVNKLGIRASTGSFITNTAPSGAAGNIDNAQMSKIVNGVTPYTDVAGDFMMCDIESVDLQRWVNITVVLSGRTQDIYIDGKLSRSCVLNGLFTVDGDQSTLVLGGPNGFGGYIGLTTAANFAYSPDQVYKKYQNGPFNNSLWNQIKNYFKNASVNVNVNGQNIASASVSS
jgi:hypothetical protein